MNICGNSDEVCKTLLDEGQRFDLVLTDPPYNVKKNFGNKEDSKTPEEYFDIENSAQAASSSDSRSSVDRVL